jgi:hypothetical protein
MNRIVIAQGFQGRLNPSGTYLGFGNGTARSMNLATGDEKNFGTYAATGWADDDQMSVTAFAGAALRMVNVNSGQGHEVPVTEPAPIYVTSDGAWWAAHGGMFYRNGVTLNPTVTLAGDLSGQVLSPDGAFFSAELPQNAYRTAVLDQHGIVHFTIPVKAAWPQMFNWSGSPHLFVTEGDDAVFYNAAGGRYRVASDVPCYRGALFLVNGELWALTISTIDGATYGFARPWQETQGIRLDMWGGFAFASQQAGGMFAAGGYNQDTGELVVCDQVPVDSARKDITETPDYGTPPPVIPPQLEPIYVSVKPGQQVIITGAT